MILMALAYQLAGTLLFFVDLIQVVLALTCVVLNARLMVIGCGLGRHQDQIANFVSFASEDLLFPFSDWPVGGQ